MIVDNMKRLKAALDLVRATDFQRRPVLLQEYLSSCPGVDWRIIVVNGRALGAMKRSSNNGEPHANIALGADAIPIDLAPEMAEISTRAANALGLDVCGVDLLGTAGNSQLRRYIPAQEYNSRRFARLTWSGPSLTS